MNLRKESDLESERCYLCGRTATEVAEVFEDDIAEEKHKALTGATVKRDEPNHADVYSEQEYELAKACQQLAPGLLSTPLEQYEKQRESLSTRYKGMETVDQLLRIPFKKNPTSIGGRQKTLKERVAAIVGTYEKARNIDRVRSEKRQQIEERFNALASEVEWIRQIPVKLRKPDGTASLPNLNIKMPVCIVCAAWEPHMDEVRHRQCPT